MSRSPDTNLSYSALPHRENPEALSQILETYRQYLLAVAVGELGEDLQAKAGASDLVQETFLQAHRHIDQFRGTTEAELAVWLRKILLRHLARLHHSLKATDKRRLSREVHVEMLEIASTSPTPSGQLMIQERDEQLRRALDQLPELYRRVIEWRNYDLLPFDRIGKLLDRSENAARKIWMRAVAELQALLEAGR